MKLALNKLMRIAKKVVISSRDLATRFIEGTFKEKAIILLTSGLCVTALGVLLYVMWYVALFILATGVFLFFVSNGNMPVLNWDRILPSKPSPLLLTSVADFITGKTRADFCLEWLLDAITSIPNGVLPDVIAIPKNVASLVYNSGITHYRGFEAVSFKLLFRANKDSDNIDVRDVQEILQNQINALLMGNMLEYQPEPFSCKPFGVPFCSIVEMKKYRDKLVGFVYLVDTPEMAGVVLQASKKTAYIEDFADCTDDEF